MLITIFFPGSSLLPGEAKEDQDNLAGVLPAVSSILSNPFWLISIYLYLAIPFSINTFADWRNTQEYCLSLFLLELLLLYHLISLFTALTSE